MDGSEKQAAERAGAECATWGISAWDETMVFSPAGQEAFERAYRTTLRENIELTHRIESESEGR